MCTSLYCILAKLKWLQMISFRLYNIEIPRLFILYFRQLSTLRLVMSLPQVPSQTQIISEEETDLSLEKLEVIIFCSHCFCFYVTSFGLDCPTEMQEECCCLCLLGTDGNEWCKWDTGDTKRSKHKGYSTSFVLQTINIYIYTNNL